MVKSVLLKLFLKKYVQYVMNTAKYYSKSLEYQPIICITLSLTSAYRDFFPYGFLLVMFPTFARSGDVKCQIKNMLLYKQATFFSLSS